MPLFDLVLLFFIAGFVWFGFWAGLIKALGRLIGLFLGIALASHYYTLLAPAWTWLFFDNQTITEIALFIIIFVFVSRITGLIFWVIDRFFDIVRFIPFLTSINRLLGAILGLIEGIIIVGVVLLLLSQYQLSDRLQEVIATSQMAGILLDMMVLITPLVPDSFVDLPFFETFKKVTGE